MADEDLLTDEEWDYVKDTITEKSISTVDSMEHPFFAQKTLFINIGVNIGLFGLFIVWPKLLKTTGLEYLTEDLIFLLIPLSVIVPFIIGFLIGYASTKLFRFYWTPPKKEEKIDRGVMSGFSYADQQSKNWTIWVIASAGGIGNLLLFAILPELIRKMIW
jgi:hypothetical protein